MCIFRVTDEICARSKKKPRLGHSGIIFVRHGRIRSDLGNPTVISHQDFYETCIVNVADHYHNHKERDNDGKGCDSFHIACMYSLETSVNEYCGAGQPTPPSRDLPSNSDSFPNIGHLLTFTAF
jgi:hypothetical protein